MCVLSYGYHTLDHTQDTRLQADLFFSFGVGARRAEGVPPACLICQVLEIRGQVILLGILRY